MRTEVTVTGTASMTQDPIDRIAVVEPEKPMIPRILGDLSGSGSKQSAGEKPPTLICVGGLHGNEPAGVEALKRVFARLEADPSCLVGRAVGLSGNRQALANRKRFLEDDLNRHWIPARVERLHQSGQKLRAEDMELVELDRELQTLLDEAEGLVYFLDIHTTSGEGPAFVNLDDTLPNRRFAMAFPAPLVVGLEEELEGTLVSYLVPRGVISLGFEAGQHNNPASVDRAEAAIWIALELAGVIRPESRPEVEEARRQLEAVTAGLPHVVEVLYRHPVYPDDGFRMDPGFVNFDPIKAGAPLAHDREGLILAQENGYLLMPLYQSLGSDGFFVIRKVHPIWLKVSEWARRSHLERFIHLFPGVKRHPETAGSYIVDRRLARWWALELFHLLGYQRRGGRYDRFLIMSRRSYYDL